MTERQKKTMTVNGAYFISITETSEGCLSRTEQFEKRQEKFLYCQPFRKN